MPVNVQQGIIKYRSVKNYIIKIVLTCGHRYKLVACKL